MIPATSLYAATLADADPADFDAAGFTVIPFSQAIVPGVAFLGQGTIYP